MGSITDALGPIGMSSVALAALTASPLLPIVAPIGLGLFFLGLAKHRREPATFGPIREDPELENYRKNEPEIPQESSYNPFLPENPRGPQGHDIYDFLQVLDKMPKINIEPENPVTAIAKRAPDLAARVLETIERADFARTGMKGVENIALEAIRSPKNIRKISHKCKAEEKYFGFIPGRSYHFESETSLSE